MEGLRKVLRSKIHRATITHADLAYEGSITLAPELLEAADIREFEAVCLWNVTSGTRLETYAILGEPGSTDVCVNGAAAHLMKPGDLIIIACFTWMPESALEGYQPKVVFVDEKNRIKEKRKEIPGPKLA
jgi:aspartate 1-decarboxylase